MRVRAAWAALAALIVVLVVIGLQNALALPHHRPKIEAVGLGVPEHVFIFDLAEKPDAGLIFSDSYRLGEVKGEEHCEIDGIGRCFPAYHILWKAEQDCRIDRIKWIGRNHSVDANFFDNTRSFPVVFEVIFDLRRVVLRYKPYDHIGAKVVLEIIQNRSNVVAFEDNKESGALCGNGSIGARFGGLCSNSGSLDRGLHVAGLFGGEFAQPGGFSEQAARSPVKLEGIKRQQAVEENQKGIGWLLKKGLIPSLFSLASWPSGSAARSVIALAFGLFRFSDLVGSA